MSSRWRRWRRAMVVVGSSWWGRRWWCMMAAWGWRWRRRLFSRCLDRRWCRGYRRRWWRRGKRRAILLQEILDEFLIVVDFICRDAQFLELLENAIPLRIVVLHAESLSWCITNVPNMSKICWHANVILVDFALSLIQSIWEAWRFSVSKCRGGCWSLGSQRVSPLHFFVECICLAFIHEFQSC